MFNREGRCIEQPAESPESTFKDRVAIAGYPVEELGGVIFAYLGAKPVPLLPRWDLFVRENALRDIGVAEIPCNWIQIMENSLDPVHVEWLHRHFYNYVRERLGRDDRCIPVRHEKIGFTVFEYGIVKRRVLEGDTEQSENWQVGHPVIFPNVLRSGSARTPVFQIRVPVDDTHTMHWWYNCYGVEPGAEAPTQEKIPLFKVPVPGVDEYGQPEWARLDNNSGQDLAMWHSQGPIADRSLEKLGESDEGIILYRKLLKDQIEKVRRGEEPMNVFRDPAKNICIRLSAEQDKAGRSVRKTRQGGATKYSPILDALEQQGTDVKDILVGSAVD
jgi:5,5'-dehydrodivanillate O-demethylase